MKMKKTLLTGIAALFLATGAAHANTKDSCQDPDYGRCRDIKGDTCYKQSNCCKNTHDWATQIRDGTVCKQKPRKK